MLEEGLIIPLYQFSENSVCNEFQLTIEKYDQGLESHEWVGREESGFFADVLIALVV